MAGFSCAQAERPVYLAGASPVSPGDLSLNDEQRRRAAIRRTLVLLTLVALAFYVGIMITMAFYK